ncbi:anti-sigma factor domain-containing protein [Blastococcus sp. LR1]|uniref:anti-sigma factor n=1 Tax=Blastococcus sp. LR1 TaxID=2877000 RepID=UPI001CCDBDF9|nr:anti-sigma factor [Blastococcus sp. LR1]MCA0143494.1 anti-sigma factor [Blastococcus sp. LR1]
MTGEHAFDELAVGWALHALEPDDEAAFARHLAGCERCVRTVSETAEVMAAMARDLPSAEPSPELRSRLRAAVETTEQLPAPEAPRPAPTSDTELTGPAPVPSRLARRRPLSRVLVAAAAAAVLGLGAWTAVLSQSREELQSTLAAQEEVVAQLTEPGRSTVVPLTDDDRRVGTLVARDDVVHVVTHGLDRNDVSTETYVLWGLGRGEPTPLGTFDVERSQIAVETVGSGSTGLDQFPGYGISIEPGRQAPSAPTGVVATGQVDS